MAKMNVKGIGKFFVDKGEKIGFGAAAFIALLAVGGMTDWSAFDKTPTQLITDAGKASSALVASTWPESEAEAHPVVSLTRLTNDAVVKPLDVSSYDFSTPMSPKIYPKTKALEEPPFLPVETLIAKAGTFVMETFPPEVEGLGGLAADGSTPAGVAALPEAGVAAVGPPGRRPPGGAAAAAAMPPGNIMAGAHGAPGGMAPAMAGGEFTPVDMMLSGMTGMGSGRSGKGVRYVSVRGVIPFRTQLEKLARALNLNTTAEASAYLMYEDFEIERQRAVRGPSPWPEGDDGWEKVDTQVAYDLLEKEAANWDLEVLSTEVIDGTFTMPLPARLDNIWTPEEVSHPRLEAWLLKEEADRVKEAEKNAQLMQSAGEQGLGGRKAGGFRKLQPDMNSLRSALPGMDGMGSMPGMAMPGMAMPEMSAGGMHGAGSRPGGRPTRPGVPGMPAGSMPGPAIGGHGMGSRPGMGMPPGMGGSMPGMPGSMPGMAGSGMPGAYGMGGMEMRTPQVVLFRYFDTVVEPGAAYRYRVRLKALNPNFGLSLDQVANASVVEGEFRWTDWSEPSNPIVVPADTVYVTAKVPRRSGRPESAVDMTVFQWNSERGTLVADTLKNYFGQFIGGKKKTKVLDVAKPSLSDEEIAIRGSDVLVDSLGVAGVTAVATTTGASPTLKGALDDLRIDKNQWVKLIDSGSLDLSVTVTPAGEMVINDNARLAAAKSRMEEEIKLEREPWKDLENAPVGGVGPGGMPATGLDLYMMEQMGGAHGGPEEKGKKKKRGKSYNPARMGSMPGMYDGSGSMPGMAMPGMPAGMPGPGAMPGAKKKGR